MSGVDRSLDGLDILLERETANDETALVVAVHVMSGSVVAKDDVLFDIENSKATQEVVAPVGGVVSHQLVVGQSVAFGVPIARIGGAATAAVPAIAICTPVPVGIVSSSPSATL